MAVLSTDRNSKATIKVLRQAKYVAALAMTTLPSDKPLNDARQGAIRILVWDLKAGQELRLRRLAEG
jgi:hypothetical protein